jgi:Spy/CpxP family protein refolding chaperone
MNVQKKRLIAILAGSLLLGSTGLAVAYGGGHGFDRAACDHGAAPMHALYKLDNVTDEQREQLRKVYQEQRDAMQQRRDAMRESRKAIREAINNGAATEELRTLATKQGEQVAEMIMAKAQMRQKMAAILTPEQIKQLQDYRAERQERRMRW